MADGTGASRRAFLTAATTGIAAVAGCNADERGETTATTATRTTTSTPEETGVDGDVLELVTGWVGTLDPVAATNPQSEAVVGNVFDGLTTFPDGDPDPEPRLAADVSVSPDGTTYTVDLVDARFHDGTPVTAADVVYSFERLAGSPNSRWSDLPLEVLGITHETTADGDGDPEYVPGSLGVTAVDDGTVEITLDEPFPPTLSVLAYPQFSVVPERIVGDIGDYDGDRAYDAFARDPVGCGPFELVTWERRERLTCGRFDDWHGGDVALDGVRWRVLDDADEAFEYARENADVVPVPDPAYDRGEVDVERTDDVGRAFGTYGSGGDDRTLDYLSVALVDTFFLGFDMSTVPKRVRRAVAYALDQRAVVERALRGRGYPAYHITPPAVYPGEAYDDHARTTYPYGYGEQLDGQARSLLHRAGYDSDDPYQLRWTHYRSPAWERVGRVLADRLASLPVELAIESVPFDQLRRRGRNGDLEAYGFRIVPDWPTPDAFLAAVTPGRTDAGRPDPASYLNWNRAARLGMATAADRARVAASNVAENPGPSGFAREARQEAFVELEEANWEDVGVVPLYHRTEERFATDRVDVDPFGGTGSHRQSFNGTSLDPPG